jgi:hypothetical protein
MKANLSVGGFFAIATAALLAGAAFQYLRSTSSDPVTMPLPKPISPHRTDSMQEPKRLPKKVKAQLPTSTGNVGQIERSNVQLTSKSDQSRQTLSSEMVRSIDWQSVDTRSPIPRSMPSRTSDDPLDAGFAVEWVERSLVDAVAAGAGVSYQPAAPVVLRIISESKDPQDSWSHGVEHAVLEIVESRLPKDDNGVSRAFCSRTGCVFYFEGMTHLGPLGVVTQALVEPWAKEFGIEGTDIYWVNGSRGPKEFHWQMVVVERRSAAR